MHQIRLHGPWDMVTRGRERDLASFGRVKLPGVVWPAIEVASESSQTELTLIRKFNRPTGLVSEQQVVLALWANESVTSLAFNGTECERITGESILPASLMEVPRASDLVASRFALQLENWHAYNSVSLVFRVAGKQTLLIAQVALEILEHEILEHGET